MWSVIGTHVVHGICQFSCLVKLHKFHDNWNKGEEECRGMWHPLLVPIFHYVVFCIYLPTIDIYFVIFCQRKGKERKGRKVQTWNISQANFDPSRFGGPRCFLHFPWRNGEIVAWKPGPHTLFLFFSCQTLQGDILVLRDRTFSSQDYLVSFPRFRNSWRWFQSWCFCDCFFFFFVIFVIFFFFDWNFHSLENTSPSSLLSWASLQSSLPRSNPAPMEYWLHPTRKISLWFGLQTSLLGAYSFPAAQHSLVIQWKQSWAPSRHLVDHFHFHRFHHHWSTSQTQIQIQIPGQVQVQIPPQIQ